jgi:hypothetical protein
MKTAALLCAALTVMGATAFDDPPKGSDTAALIGRWDLTVRDGNLEYPSWLEVRRSGRATLVGSYVGQFGSARPISKVELTDGKFMFVVPPQWERRQSEVVCIGRTEGETIWGETTNDQGKKVTWEGVRAPKLKREKPPQWSEPIELFNGKDLSGWKQRQPDVKHGWLVKDGMLVNETPGNDLLTERTFDDFKLHIEFRYPAGSNSGVYLRGRYEFQIEDNFGDEPDNLKIGGVYGFLTPSHNAAKKPDEWQSADIELVGRVVTVVLNGERIIDRQTIPGVTGGAIDSREGEPGPILLQGDHGPIEFRRVTIIPAK